MNTRSKKARVVENEVLNNKGRDAENEVRNDPELDGLRAELAVVKRRLLEKVVWIGEMSSLLNEVGLKIRLMSATVGAQQFVLEKLRTGPDEEMEQLMERMIDSHRQQQVMRRDNEQMEELLQRMRRRLVELNSTRQTDGSERENEEMMERILHMMRGRLVDELNPTRQTERSEGENEQMMERVLHRIRESLIDELNPNRQTVED